MPKVDINTTDIQGAPAGNPGLSAEHSLGSVGIQAAVAGRLPESAEELDRKERQLRERFRRASKRLAEGRGGRFPGHLPAAEAARQREELEALSDPAALVERLAIGLGPLRALRPAAALHAHARASAAVSYLRSQIPRGKLSPLAEPGPGERGAEAAFRRQLQVAADPSKALQHAAAGTLAPEHVAALRTIYPELHRDAVAQVLQHAAEHRQRGKSVPSRSRSMIAMLAGEDMEGDGGRGLARNQQLFAQKAAARKAAEQSGKPGERAASLEESAGQAMERGRRAK